MKQKNEVQGKLSDFFVWELGFQIPKLVQLAHFASICSLLPNVTYSMLRGHICDLPNQQPFFFVQYIKCCIRFYIYCIACDIDFQWSSLFLQSILSEGQAVNVSSLYSVHPLYQAISKYVVKFFEGRRNYQVYVNYSLDQTVVECK